MKLPKVSGGVGWFGVNRVAEENSGILPSRLFGGFNPQKPICRARCRANQAAGVAICGSDVACIANAIAAGEACYSDC